MTIIGHTLFFLRSQLTWIVRQLLFKITFEWEGAIALYHMKLGTMVNENMDVMIREKGTIGLSYVMVLDLGEEQYLVIWLLRNHGVVPR